MILLTFTCLGVHRTEVKLTELIKLEFNKGKKVWTSKYDKLWGSE